MSGQNKAQDAGHPPPPAVALQQMFMGFIVTQLIYVASKLRIADLLRDGPKSSSELAELLGANARALYRILRALASLTIFTEDEDGRFGLTPLAELLQSGVPDSQRAFATLYGDEWFWKSWGALIHTAKTGETAFDHVHGVGFFDYLERNSEAAEIFNAAMTGMTAPHAAAVVAAYDFSGIQKIVDVGGGHGSLVATILKAYPGMRGVLCDVPSVIEGARRVLSAEGLAHRCELVSCDFFKSVPEGGDAYTLKDIIQDWDEEDAVAILKNCRRAMANNGKLLLLERVIPPKNKPSPGKLVDIIMLVITGGHERTEAEYGALLNVAGFKLTKVVPTQSEMSVIEGVPV